ncbi:MAG TPA: hypothetical protein VMS65_14235 [Polyangiaceae bacterium]|nr:hypothetical protein [Polyangiaceae bacterium]
MRAVLAAALALGCGSAALRVPAEDVRPAETLPAGYETIGRVVASCRGLDGFRATDDVLLASFDCDRARLERVLAERVAELGGDVVVGTDCGRDGSVLRCTGAAARPDDERGKATVSKSDPGPVPGARAVERWDEPRASVALVIRVDFEPTVEHFERARRRATDVAEVAALPVTHRELGLLTTRCDAEECELRELRQGLRIAAGGLGASDLVGVRCFGRDGERECVATLAASEVDE